jgi:hypothetical protein
MCSLHMNIDGSYTITFIVFDETLAKSRFLYQNIAICLPRFTNDALQHLRFH